MLRALAAMLLTASSHAAATPGPPPLNLVLIVGTDIPPAQPPREAIAFDPVFTTTTDDAAARRSIATSRYDDSHRSRRADAPPGAPPDLANTLRSQGYDVVTSTAQLTAAREHPFFLAISLAPQEKVDLDALWKRLTVLEASTMTVVAVVSLPRSDAGGHGALSDRSLRVRWWLSSPPRSRKLPDAASPATILDVAPTLLGEVGFSSPPEFRGRDLGATPAPPGLLFASLAPVAGTSRAVRGYAARSGAQKLIWYRGQPVLELYNTAQDPLESSNLIQREPSVAAALMRALLEHLDDPDRSTLPRLVEKSSPDKDLSEQSKEALRRMGYMR